MLNSRLVERWESSEWSISSEELDLMDVEMLTRKTWFNFYSEKFKLLLQLFWMMHFKGIKDLSLI